MRRTLRRAARSTTNAVGPIFNDPIGTSSSNDDVSDSCQPAHYTGRGEDLNGNRKAPTVSRIPAAATSYIDCYSIARRGDHLNRNWIKQHQHDVDGYYSRASATMDNSAGARIVPTTAGSMWSATLLRNLDFRLVDIDELPVRLTVPSASCRSAYVIADSAAILEGNKSSAVGGRQCSAPDKNGYSYARRSTTNGLSENEKKHSDNREGLVDGNNLTLSEAEQRLLAGNSTMEGKSEIEQNLPSSCDTTGNSRRNAANVRQPDAGGKPTPPPIPPKPKDLKSPSSDDNPAMQVKTRQHQREKQETETRMTPHRKYGGHETVPPPLPARVNLVNFRQGTLPPPPPPPPRRTDSLLMKRPAISIQSTSFDSSRNFSPPNDGVVDSSVNEISATAATSSKSDDDKTSQDDNDKDDNSDNADLDYNVSVCSSLTALNDVDGCLQSIGEQHQNGRGNERSGQTVEENDYEPITPQVGSGVKVTHLPTSTLDALQMITDDKVVIGHNDNKTVNLRCVVFANRSWPLPTMACLEP